MYTTKLSIKKSARIDYGDYQDSALDILYRLIGLFINNGQIADCHNLPHFITNDNICVIVNSFNDDNLDKKYHNIYINDVLNKLNDDDFSFEILGKELESHAITTPDKTNAFILTTSCYSTFSPVKSIDFDVIPLHYLPKTYHDNEEYFDIICW